MCASCTDSLIVVVVFVFWWICIQEASLWADIHIYKGVCCVCLCIHVCVFECVFPRASPSVSVYICLLDASIHLCGSPVAAHKQMYTHTQPNKQTFFSLLFFYLFLSLLIIIGVIAFWNTHFESPTVCGEGVREEEFGELDDISV